MVKKTYKIANRLKENNFWISLFNKNPQNTFSRENMIWQVATFVYAKEFMENIFLKYIF